jgi:hypothetical protein
MVSPAVHGSPMSLILLRLSVQKSLMASRRNKSGFGHETSFHG